jgi:acyl-coenzyme A thioesterase 13
MRRSVVRFVSDAVATARPNWITIAQADGASVWVGRAFTCQDGFDSNFESMRVTEVNDGHVRCTLPVTRSLSNLYGTLHGGASATLVDILGTMAMMSRDASKPGVSVDLNISFTAAAPIGELLTLDGRVIKGGRRLAFTEVEIRRADGTLVATGRHTKAL